MPLEVLGLLFADKPRTRLKPQSGFVQPKAAPAAPKLPSVPGSGDVEIPVDAALTVAHKYGLQVTSVPIQDGSSVQDHAVRDPDALTMEGFVSDHPVQLLGGMLSDVVGGAVGDQLGITSRSLSAYAQLVDAVEKKKLLTVVTRFKVYENMLPDSLEVRQQHDVGEALAFTLGLTKTTIVASATSSVLDKLTDAAKDNAAPTASRGSKPPKPPAAAAKKRAANWLDKTNPPNLVETPVGEGTVLAP